MQAMAALSDPTRREIVASLMDEPADAGTIANRFPISRPAISRHLRVLREAGLVEVEPDAQRRVYHLRAEPLQEIDHWLDKYRQFWGDKLDALDDHLTEDPA